MVLAVVIVALVVGLALVILGRRGRRTDDHPLCRRCRFDLTGRPADAERRCPECGADLEPPRATIVGHPPAAGGGAGDRRGPVHIGGSRRRGADLGTGEPDQLDAVRAGQLSHASGNIGEACRDADLPLAELSRRYAVGRLSVEQQDALTDAALAYQADGDKPWDSAWGDVLERGRAAGRLSDARWERYVSGSIRGAFSWEPPSRPVHRGGQLEYAAQSCTRTGCCTFRRPTGIAVARRFICRSLVSTSRVSGPSSPRGTRWCLTK